MLINIIESIMDTETHLKHHEILRRLVLNCHLIGDKGVNTKGSIVTATVEKVTNDCHVMEIASSKERFGVYRGWYKELEEE